MNRMSAHAKTLKNKAEIASKAKENSAMAGVHQEQRRAERKIARETRAKEQAKTQMKNEIRRLLIDKAQVANPSVNTELMEIHGCFEKNKHY